MVTALNRRYVVARLLRDRERLLVVTGLGSPNYRRGAADGGDGDLLSARIGGDIDCLASRRHTHLHGNRCCDGVPKAARPLLLVRSPAE